MIQVSQTDSDLNKLYQQNPPVNYRIKTTTDIGTGIHTKTATTFKPSVNANELFLLHHCKIWQSMSISTLTIQFCPSEYETPLWGKHIHSSLNTQVYQERKQILKLISALSTN